MLRTLALTVNEATLLARRPLRSGVAFDPATLQAFRAKVGDFQALLRGVEDQLVGLDDLRAAELTARFRCLEVLMLTLVARSTPRFFDPLSSAAVPPPGTGETCRSQLRLLADTRARLGHPAYAQTLQPDLDPDLTEAEECLGAIIAREPAPLACAAA